jgi:hypothetical protein
MLFGQKEMIRGRIRGINHTWYMAKTGFLIKTIYLTLWRSPSSRTDLVWACQKVETITTAVALGAAALNQGLGIRSSSSSSICQRNGKGKGSRCTSYANES